MAWPRHCICMRYYQHINNHVSRRLRQTFLG
ncbi:hypothetical protein VD0002_g9927 [Verticillium dahliae]|nr:hypothetical protein VD0002_g9927 [Verticillium dahliae]